MAIIYTYPEQSVITGQELVLVSSDNEEKSTKNVTLQQIANLNGTNPGVSSVFFADSLGLSPSTTQAGADPTVATGVVQVTGTILAIGGGTGKDSTALTAANVGDVLVVNSSKDGFDFSTASSGETYDLSTIQNTTTPANVDLTLTDSSGAGNNTRVTLVPGSSGNVTLTADATVTPPTITIESSGGGSGTTYQSGNGISIDTTTTPDTLSVAIGTSAGLGFNSSSQLVTSLTPSNIASTSGASNGAVLTYDGSSAMTWTEPGYNPQVRTEESLSLVYIDQTTGNYEIKEHTGINNLKGSVDISQNTNASGNKSHLINFTISFQRGTTTTIAGSDTHLGIALDSAAAIFSNGPSNAYSGSVGVASIVDSTGALKSSGFGIRPTTCIIPSKANPSDSSSASFNVANGLGDLNYSSATKYIWLGGQVTTTLDSVINYSSGSVAWILSSVTTTDTIFLSGTISAYGNF